jgi:hypothetical protein
MKCEMAQRTIIREQIISASLSVRTCCKHPRSTNPMFFLKVSDSIHTQRHNMTMTTTRGKGLQRGTPSTLQERPWSFVVVVVVVVESSCLHRNNNQQATKASKHSTTSTITTREGQQSE